MIPRGLPVFPHGAVLVDLQAHLTGEQATRLARRLTGRYGGRLGVLATLGDLQAWVELVAAPDGPLAAVTGWGGDPVGDDLAQRLAIGTAHSTAG